MKSLDRLGELAKSIFNFNLEMKYLRAEQQKQRQIGQGDKNEG